MPKHIARLLLLLVAFGVVAIAAKMFFTADSFYMYGHYRGKSVAEIASEKPRYRGPEFCNSCHAERFAEWSTGVHNSADIGKVVRCEVCHGAAGGRDERDPFEYATGGPDHPNNVKLIVPTDTTRLCTLCHERTPGRPVEQRQIVAASHAGSQQCTTCHNAHSPKQILIAAASTPRTGNIAAGKQKAVGCAACHGAQGVSGNPSAPHLAGQKNAYLVLALQSYRVGTRNDPVMSGLAKGLSDSDIDDLAAHYANSKCKGALRAHSQQTAAAGKAIASKCAACHGPNGVSPNPLWPNLAGQSREYLEIALKAYQRGARNNAFMTSITKDLSDAEVEALAVYYASLSCR